jgi:indolepyruvate ferredoxin oxidoreductase beta subunit
MESLRYLPYLSAEGWLLTNDKVFNNIVNYPEETTVIAEIKKVKNHIIIPADEMAKELKAPRSMNIIMAGAASALLDMDYEMMETGIKAIFGRKGEEVVAQNLRALEAGREFVKNYKA